MTLPPPPTDLSLPATLVGSKIELSFVADADVGVKLAHIRHKEGGNLDITTSLDDPAFTNSQAVLGELDGRLWEVRCTLDSGSTVTVSPKDSSRFYSYNVGTIYDVSGGHLYIWEGCEVAGADQGDRINVTVLVEHDGSGSVARWEGWVTRAKGASCTIDELHLPVLWIKGFSSLKTAPADADHTTAQRRTRVLIPVALQTATVFPGQNGVLQSWALLNGTSTLTSPFGGQPMQFFAMCAMNAETSAGVPDPAYRRLFYAQTEDDRHFHKAFRYRGLSYTGSQAWLGYRVIHYPGYEKGLAKNNTGLATDWPNYDPGLRASRTCNTYQTPYPIAVGCMTAATDHFWWKACDFYRTWMEGTSIPEKGKIESNVTFGSDSFPAKPSQSALFVQQTPTLSGAAMFNRVLQIARTMVKIGESSSIADPFKLIHLQTWTSSYVSVGIPDYPITDTPGGASVTIGTGLIDMVSSAFSDYDIRVSLYSRPTDFSGLPGWIARAKPDELQFSRAGTPVNLAEFYMSWSNSNANSGVADKLYLNGVLGEILKAVGNGGFYMDQATAGNLSYGAQNGSISNIAVQHVDHGGNYMYLAKRQFVRLAREMIRYGSIKARQAGGYDTGAMVYMETPDETMIGELDFTLEGYLFMPGSLALGEETNLGVPSDYPVAARDWSVPLWTCVYHEYQPATQLAVALSRYGLAAGADAIYPIGGFPGYTQAQFRELMCFCFASVFAWGMKTGFFHYHTDFDRLLLELNTSGALYDPTGTGVCTTIGDFLNVLCSATLRGHAGQFTQFGRLMIPLVQDLAAAVNTKATNPISVCPTAVRPQDYFATRPFFHDANGGWDSAYGAFQCPAILLNMWRSQEGKIGLVLVNWTNASADFQGTFNPALYGLANSYSVARIDPDTTEFFIASTSGTKTVGTTSTAPNIDLGTVPARSVRVFRFY